MADHKNIKIERPHFKNLDGLRFFAALSVFIFHFVNELKTISPEVTETKLYKSLTIITSKGTLGVNLFFVLSGFLITYLILFEIKSKGTFNLKHFLIRRTLRIWPLYYFIVLIGFVIFPLIFNDYHTTHQWINYVFFLANFDEIANGANDSINFLTSPWSVAVEEQFYLFWGVMFFILSTFFYKKKLSTLKIPIIIGFLILITLIFRQTVSKSQYHTLSALPDLLIGAGLGYLYMINSKWLYKIMSMSKFKIIGIYILGTLLILFDYQIFHGHLIVFERYLIALFFTFIILDQISFKNSFYQIEKIKGTKYLGQMSYGLYMYHLVVIFVLEKLIDFSALSPFLALPIFLVLSVIITFLVSLASYKWLEKPFLSMKRRFI